eukprot:Phypoly_transcript_15784.p1 GENE.Phypoly_transcript_15784~~Phypoly_transcript_15784.p1  ORF type:complete len:295 (+),score=39.43 Phypoly_transcript_15784:91-885(+)
MSLSSSHLSSLSFAAFSTRFLWILFPASKNPGPRRPILAILVEDTLPTLVIAILKMFAYEWITDWLASCLLDGAEVSARFPAVLFYSYLFALMFVMMDYPFNILNALTPLVTLDYYHFPPVNTWFLFSNSPRVFWGRRYNRIIHTIFLESVFVPLQDMGFSSTFSAFAAFIVSGIFHAHVFYRVIGLELSMIVYFIIQGVACMVDAKMGWAKWSKPKGFGIMLLLHALTIPMFFGHAVRLTPMSFGAMPHVIPWRNSMPVPGCY